ERARLLGAVPLFADLTKRHLGQVARLVDEIHPSEGDLLAREGERGDEFFVVVEGAVVVTRGERELARLGPGDHF
ncbi:MAG: cyclic nucleotide-binding domain-containing protein, partial [Actinobacteria bacterium]|nr:cyclic nucleotide-binding domain-containing protein [Actinomycetota bacterium]NIT96349.1 cyclic nucleotide-binding domain-containing protein [Actinomycetota bacterium]NIU67607.1 cyclic nucleotide-binding domain-containing protein [Actinomycetota bacterium]NIW29375.1 cyclic nucleotide-binding domain-containing protein [Actinomycetota bacterium]NIX51333.1 cyclic nucleotide-binding domain-containing protein [Actinomycetota bacterium]